MLYPIIPEPPLLAPSDQVKLSYVRLVNILFLVKLYGASGSVAATTKYAFDCGPSPIELTADTLKLNCLPA